jgi:hypothetical protein
VRANREAYDGDAGGDHRQLRQDLGQEHLPRGFQRSAATVATAGNYNNEIGVPLTLARLDGDTRLP